MEMSSAERTRLGFFLVISAALLVGTVGWLVIRQFLTRDVAYFTSLSESVDGLNAGAKVKLNGVDVGSVTRVLVDAKDLGRVQVHFEVRRGTPVKSGMRANLVGGLSVTGLKSVELTGGNALEPDLPEGSLVPAGTSQLKLLTGQAESIVLKTEQVMNNMLSLTGDENLANIASMIRDLSRLSHNIDTLVQSNRGTLMNSPAQLDSTVRAARRMIDELRAAKLGESMQKTVASYQDVALSAKKELEAARIQEAVASIESAAKALETGAKRMDLTIYRAQDDLQSSMKNLRETMENMADFSRQIKENPSLLLRTEEKSARPR